MFLVKNPSHIPKQTDRKVSASKNRAQKYNITQYEELGFSLITQVKDDYATNSQWENVLFELESERVKQSSET